MLSEENLNNHLNRTHLSSNIQDFDSEFGNLFASKIEAPQEKFLTLN